MEKKHSFARLWSYLKVYKVSVILAVFLKILSVVMSVLEPFVLGLAITELTSNLLDMAKGVEGAHINASYVGWVMVLYLSLIHISFRTSVDLSFVIRLLLSKSKNG